MLQMGTIAKREQFERDGFYLSPVPVIPTDLVTRAVLHMDAVIAGEYETGIAPIRSWNPGDDPKRLRKLDDAQVSDRTILELITLPVLGRIAAELTGAKMIQIWATQLLLKPPGGNHAGNIGWHQDRQYWKYWDGEVFTAWVALSNVREDCGPMNFVRGSHRWGERPNGDSFRGNDDMNAQRRAMQPPDAAWDEVPAVLLSGAVSFHHRLTVHGSGPNLSDQPRRSIALHMRTENSVPAAAAKDYYTEHLDNPILRPIIYDTR